MLTAANNETEGHSLYLDILKFGPCVFIHANEKKLANKESSLIPHECFHAPYYGNIRSYFIIYDQSLLDF